MKKLIKILMMLPIFCEAQNIPMNSISFYHSPDIYSRKRINFAISKNYNDYENKMDKATAFGLVAVMMSPCILAFSNSVNQKDNLGMAFYGSYSVISVTAGLAAVINLVKARKIKNRKIKNS